MNRLVNISVQFFLFVLLNLFYSVSGQLTIYVDSSNTSGTEYGTQEYPFNTIQEGIEAASSGDTVLVYPGTYPENVNLNAKHIIIGSLFMQTSDTSYISQTILDGSSIGTVFCGEYSDFTLIGLTLQNGQAGDMGAGGLEMGNGTSTIKYCKFLYNNGIGIEAWGAGGIICNIGNYRIINCTIKENYSPAGASAIRAGDCNINIINTLISGNTGNMAIHYNGASGTVLNTTIVGNDAGILFNNSPIMVRNCILWNNNMSNWGVLSDIEYTNSESGLSGTGNISKDPLFVNATNGDYRLRDGSPCINAGTSDTSGLNLSPTDLTGNPRIYKERIDMGAYESIIPDVPDTTTICYSEDKSNIIASGNDIRWYSDEILTNILHNGDALTPDVSRPETNAYYTYYVTQTINKESVPKKVILTVKPSPDEPEIILKGSDILICLDSGMYSYNWYFEDEQFINETKQFFEVKNPLAGNYYVETGYENNCKTRSDPFNFTSKSENLKSSQLFIEAYPVPNTGNFTLKLTGDESGRVIINIRDYIGTTVKSLIIDKSTKSLSEEIDLLSIPKGIYMIEILFNNESYFRRIVIN